MTCTINNCTNRKISSNEVQLIAKKNIPKGEIIIEETPLFHIPLQRSYILGTYAWDMVARLLEDQDLLRKYQRYSLMVSDQIMDPMDLEIENYLIQKYKKSRKMVRSIYFSIATNNIGLINTQKLVDGYGIFEWLSRSDHSCVPSAYLDRCLDERPTLRLVAHRDIQIGEAITWCYFRESEFIPASYDERNLALLNIFRFVCRCPRCTAERPVELKNPKAYFDQIIHQNALKIAEDPQAISDAYAATPLVMHGQALRK